jgi:hypothetical protein
VVEGKTESEILGRHGKFQVLGSPIRLQDVVRIKIGVNCQDEESMYRLVLNMSNRIR